MNRVKLVLFVMVLAVTGCSSGSFQPALKTRTPEIQFNPEPSPTQAKPSPTNLPATPTGSPEILLINPLTGLPMEQTWRQAQRPILIKVSNFPRNNRPQWGLSFVDIVFEHYAEGGLSRFSALFYGQEAEVVGPIRSGRLIDLELIEMYSAIFAYGSADYRVREAIAAADFAERAVSEYPARCPPMCRFDPTNLNHLITNTLDLRDYLTNKGQTPVEANLEGMHFDRTLPASGTTALDLEIHYSSGNFHRWMYDPVADAYFRWQETGQDEIQTAPLVDRLTGSQLAASNVILVLVPHTYVSQSPEFIAIELSGEGRAFAFRDGTATEVRWRRPEAGGVLQFEQADGSPYALRPGTTWVELVNTSAEIEERAEGAWWVRNHLP